MSDFPARVDALLDELFHLEPVLATDAGMHDHDARWPDPSTDGEALLLAFVGRWTAELTAIRGLAPEEAIDRDFLLLELEALRFSTEELRELDWDALAWVYLVGAGIFPLVAREFAPPAVRLASLAGRLEGLPALLRVAEDRLGSRPGLRPSLLHAQTALRQAAGIRALVEEALAGAEVAADGGDGAVAALLPRLRDAAGLAARALDDFTLHLERRILPIAEGDGRLGAERFAAKLRRTLKSATPDVEGLEAAAAREFAAVRAEMVRLARELWPAWVGGAPLPADEEATVRGVLDAIGAEHQEAAAILDFCRAEVARIETFCRERDVIALAEEPLAIEWTPVFLRSGGGAMLIPPGPLDRGEKAFFAVTPIPDDWSAEQRESYLREDNDRMLRLLSIHEAVPGHYLQLAAANRCPSLPRIVLGSGVFAEGWAVYVTQVMMDLGYGAEDPALMLVHWKFYLRAVVNALIDVRIHVRGMTQDEALELMVRGGFQEEAEARAKWDRARLTSTQLSTYFVGSLEMWRLERDRRVQLALASGDPRGAAAVPEARVVGGLGETPGFSYRTHLESVIAHGTPPIPVLRRILLGE